MNAGELMQAFTEQRMPDEPASFVELYDLMGSGYLARKLHVTQREIERYRDYELNGPRYDRSGHQVNRCIPLVRMAEIRDLQAQAARSFVAREVRSGLNVPYVEITMRVSERWDYRREVSEIELDSDDVRELADYIERGEWDNAGQAFLDAWSGEHGYGMTTAPDALLTEIHRADVEPAVSYTIARQGMGDDEGMYGDE